MFEIKIKVKGNGTLEWGNDKRLRLGTTGENQRTKLLFDVDDSIEGEYQYIKFAGKRATYLYRVHNQMIVLSKNLLVYDGLWKFSFISTNGVITNNQITGSYAFITEPVEALVVKGILSDSLMTEEEEVLKSLCNMNFTNLVIPDSVTSIGNYFMYNSKRTFSLKIGAGVSTIGTYAFYGATLTSVSFDEYSDLSSLNECAFYNVTINGDIVFPTSLSSWGKYVLQNSTVNKISFEKGSSLRTLSSYALWENSAKEIELPNNLTTLSGNTYVIKNCTELTRLWIPKSIQNTIPSNAIYGCTNLSNIELEAEFDIDAYFDNCNLAEDSMVNMFYALKNRRSTTSGKLVLGSANLAKLTDVQKAIAINKNWTLS